MMKHTQSVSKLPPLQLPEGVRIVAHEPLVLRGFAEPVEVCSVTGDPVLTDRNDTGELWTRSPFVM